MRAPRSFSPVAAASQIATRSRSNHAYAFSDYASVSRSYTSNGLNQYATVGGNNYGYDSNGNLTADGTIAYTYDAENRLVVTSAGANLTYDPLGRLYRVTGALTDTRFLYDGDQLAAEYDSAGNVTRRYMHSTGIDEPLTAYQGGSVGDAARSYLYADHQGSIVAVANAWSNPMAINSYDDYGIPGWGNSGRFQYTGQAWIPELGMYHYKARVYSPTLGRFLQTDPIGYDDQVNLYAYVGNDPINWSDPTGTISVITDTKIDCSSTVAIDIPCSGGSDAEPQDVPSSQAKPKDSYTMAELAEENRSRPSTGDIGERGSDAAFGFISIVDSYFEERGKGATVLTALSAALFGGTVLGGKKPADSSKNERHGDPNAISKADRQIAELRSRLSSATTRAEKLSIQQKIKNIQMNAMRNAKGETHGKRGKRR